MKKLLILSTALLIVPTIALAAPAPKVFVCKYVGTPGSNETLQTGQNPISVSSNAIKDYKGPGSYFNDAQGRSYVLAEDTGQEPNVSQCPTPINPTPPPTIQSPPVVTTPPAPTTSPAPATPSVSTETINYSNFVGK